MQWNELEQELVKRFGPNYHNYPMSVEIYIKLRKKVWERKRSEEKNEKLTENHE